MSRPPLNLGSVDSIRYPINRIKKGRKGESMTLDDSCIPVRSKEKVIQKIKEHIEIEDLREYCEQAINKLESDVLIHRHSILDLEEKLGAHQWNSKVFQKMILNAFKTIGIKGQECL
jgi:hypothetical protein